MAAKKKATEATAPVVEVNLIDLKKIVAFADNERRSTAANADTERALSILVRTADEIAQQAGDIPTFEFSGSPIEKERRAKRIARLADSLEKVRISVRELAVA